MSQLDVMEKLAPSGAANCKRQWAVPLKAMLNGMDLACVDEGRLSTDVHPTPNRRRPAGALPEPYVSNVSKGVELAFRIDSDPGALGRLLDFVQACGIHVLAYNAYSDWDGAVLLLVTKEAWRAKAVIEAAGLKCTANSVLLVEAGGWLATAARCGIELGNAGIQILYSYASVSTGNRCYAVFKTTDDDQAQRVLDGSALTRAA